MASAPGRLAGALLLVTVVLAACGDAEYAREDAIEDMIDEGVTEEVANCSVDAYEEYGGDFDDDFQDLARADVERLLGGFLECQGAVAEVSECVVAEVFEIVAPGGARGLELIVALNDLQPEDQVALLQAGLTCQGLPDDTAECVTDRMEQAFGEELFETERLELTPEQQAEARSFIVTCLSDSGSQSREAIIDVLAGQLAAGLEGSGAPPISDEEAHCAAGAMVDALGLERAAELSFPSADDVADLALEPDEADRVAQGIVGWVDVVDLLSAQLVAEGVPRETASCMAKDLASSGAYANILAVTLSGAAADSPEITSAVQEAEDRCG